MLKKVEVANYAQNSIINNAKSAKIENTYQNNQITPKKPNRAPKTENGLNYAFEKR